MQHERVVLMETSEGSLLPFHFGATRLGVGASENFVIPNSSGAVQLFNVASLQNSDGEDDRPQRDSVQHDFVSALVQAAEKADRLFVSPGRGSGALQGVGQSTRGCYVQSVLYPVSYIVAGPLSVQRLPKILRRLLYKCDGAFQGEKNCPFTPTFVFSFEATGFWPRRVSQYAGDVTRGTKHEAGDAIV
jgi:hypothetical protein